MCSGRLGDGCGAIVLLLVLVVGPPYTFVCGFQLTMHVLPAGTYAIASSLPPFILDILLNIPSILISIRNAFLPIQPYIRPPAAASAAPPTPGASTAAARKQITAAGDDSSPSETEAVNRAEQPRREEVVSDVETGSEADVESNTEHDSGAEHEGAGHGGLAHDAGMASMASSWVNLSS